MLRTWFESCVVSDGNQTIVCVVGAAAGFESCVVSDGNQTRSLSTSRPWWFESCVVSDGNQTVSDLSGSQNGLRVVLFLMVTKLYNCCMGVVMSLRVVLFLMVTKLLAKWKNGKAKFESCVVSDGNQTLKRR